MKNKRAVFSAVFWILLCAGFTAAVKLFDVEAIGPNESKVGFSALNAVVFDLTGSIKLFDLLSDAILVVAFLIALIFAVKGLVQMIRRRSLIKVDKEILMMGITLVLMMAVYAAFEFITINYRPVMPDGVLEASYPSTHTMIAITVLGCVKVYFKDYPNKPLFFNTVIVLIMILAAVVRILSGMHWTTDVIAGFLFGIALSKIYEALLNRPEEDEEYVVGGDEE